MDSYTETNGGWFEESTGPLALRDSLDVQVGEHETRSIYRFTEGFSLYDLSLQLAVKSADMPVFEFMQGEEVMTAQCYNDP